MIPRLRAWLRDELTKVVRSEISQTNATLEATLHDELGELHHELQNDRDATATQNSARDHELASAISHLADAIGALHHRIDADINERQLHLSSVEWLMRELIISFPQPNTTSDAPSDAHTILGGTIERDPATQLDGAALSPTSEIDLREAERHVGMLVEVRSRFHDRWIRGFEIIEIVDIGDLRRFRLSRISDRIALPVLFDTYDIRPLPVLPEVETAERPA